MRAAPPGVAPGPAPATRLEALTRILSEWQPVWRSRPFQEPDPAWTRQFPDAAAALLQLPDTTVASIEEDPLQPSLLGTWLPVEPLARWVDLPALPGRGPLALPPDWDRDVPGRKSAQILAFLHHADVPAGGTVVDWCAGKGHLARALASGLGATVLALEQDAHLCAEGERLAARDGLAIAWRPVDVLGPRAREALDRGCHVAALHACGDLHVRLLTLASEIGCGVSLAPCCYHRTAAADPAPLSRSARDLARAHGLHFTREDLALASRETATAPASERRRRDQARAWRLAFDQWQRGVRGTGGYLPLPSLSAGRMPDGFAAFMHWAAALKGLELPARSDWGALERAGWQRLAQVRRWELALAVFRRPIEVWLALDRLLFLEEQGFEARLGVFCNRSSSPRNLLLRAQPRKA
jgi:hypothetical protein